LAEVPGPTAGQRLADLKTRHRTAGNSKEAGEVAWTEGDHRGTVDVLEGCEPRDEVGGELVDIGMFRDSRGLVSKLNVIGLRGMGLSCPRVSIDGAGVCDGSPPVL
jgi:hypothetical protein